MRVLVTGCNGWIGRKVCEYLSSQKIEVIGADILECGSAGMRDCGFLSDYIQLDITKPIPHSLTSDVGHPISDIGAVIHCAGYAHRPNETPAEQKLFYAVNRDGTKHMLDWCEQKGVERFLYVSSIAFYDWLKTGGQKSEVGGQNGAGVRLISDVRSLMSGNAVTEGHPVALPTHYAKSKYQGEELVRNSSLDWRVVRLATVFGEGDKANFSRMASAMKKHLFPIPGKGVARKSVIPVDLAAELIAQFALIKSPPHQLINLGLPEASSLSEIAESYHLICGLPKCPSIPMPLAKGLGICGDLAAKVLGKFPFNSDTLRKLTTDTVVSVDRMLECFPERAWGTFEDYLEHCKEWYRSR